MSPEHADEALADVRAIVAELRRAADKALEVANAKLERGEPLRRADRKAINGALCLARYAADTAMRLKWEPPAPRRRGPRIWRPDAQVPDTTSSAGTQSDRGDESSEKQG